MHPLPFLHPYVPVPATWYLVPYVYNIISATMAATTAKALTWRFQQPLLSSSKCRVVFCGPHFQAALPAVEAVLQSSSTLLETEAVELIHAPDAAALAAVAPTAHIVVPFMERLMADFIATSPDLRLIMQYGVGLEGVDVAAATSHRVAVSNIPAEQSGNAAATAEHAVYLTMGLLRHAYDLDRRFSSQQLGGLPIPRTVVGKRITVVGHGAVGETVCRYLATMGARVSAVRRRPWTLVELATVDGLQRVNSLSDALPCTDVLILACPVTPDTVNLVNSETLAQMPAGALVVNVGRGPLVEHAALVQALTTGHIGGYASDVGVGHSTKPSEPWDPADELTRLPNTMFTPHIGGYTDYSYDKMAAAVGTAIACIVRSEPPPVWVNRDPLL